MQPLAAPSCEHRMTLAWSSDIAAGWRQGGALLDANLEIALEGWA